MIGEVVTVPICSGSMSSTSSAWGQNVLGCSVPWTTKTGLFIDPVYSPLLEFMLNSGGIDWPTTYQVMGYSLGFFAIGSVFGSLFNILRRAKSR